MYEHLILFYQSIYLSLCQYYTVLITVHFEIGKCKFSSFILLFQGCFGNSVVLCIFI